MKVDLQYAKAHLLRLLKAVALGDEIVITEAGEPVAKLISFRRVSGQRKLGSAKGDFVVPSDFNRPLPVSIKDSFWK